MGNWELKEVSATCMGASPEGMAEWYKKLNKREERLRNKSLNMRLFTRNKMSISEYIITSLLKAAQKHDKDYVSLIYLDKDYIGNLLEKVLGSNWDDFLSCVCEEIYCESTKAMGEK